MKKNIVLSSIATVALVSLVGCGGGGSTPAAEVSTSTLSGVAVDDLIFDGLVTAKKADGTELASGRTSETDGTYTLDVAHDGVVLLNVLCDENSTMGLTSSDAVSCADQGVTLNSLADVTPGVAQTVNISPLTEIVYQAALETAGTDSISEDDFDEARSDIGAMLGVDPIAENPTEGDYAQIIDVIHTIAEESDSTVIAVTAALAAALSDGEAEGEDEVVAFTEAMADENLTNNLTDNNGTYTPIAPEVLTNIEEAKALFAELRTQAMSVVDYDNSGTPGFMDTEAVDMEAALNDVVMNVGFIGESLNSLAEGIDHMMSNDLSTVSGEFGPNRDVTITAGTTVGNWTYVMQEGGVEKWNGSVSIPAVLLGDDAAAELYTSGTLTMTVDGTVPLDEEAVTEEGVTDSQSFEGTISITKKSTGADIAISGEVASNGTSIALTEATAELAYTESPADEEGYTEPVFDYFKLNNVVLQGIVGGYTIDGSITVNSYVQNNGLKDNGGFVNNYGFGISFYCDDGSQGIVTSNVVYSDQGETQVLEGPYTYFNWVDYRLDGFPYEVEYSQILDNLTYQASCTSGAAIQTNIYDVWDDEEVANSGWLPNDITFAGALSRTGAALEGTLNAKWLNAATMDMESEDAMPLVEVAFNGKLQMPDRPEMLATLTFVNSETHNTIGASYTHGSTVINMSALFDADMDNADVEITTHTGLRADLKVVDGDLITDGTGTVTKDGSLVGTLEEREDVPVIKYVDGSFESLP